MKLKKLIIQGISVFLGFTFWGSGMAKLFFEHKFFGWMGPVWLIDELAKYDLGFYGAFIAYFQVIIGYLLVTTRYKLLGSIMMLPLLANILMVTISLQWKGTPFVICFFLLLNTILLWQYRDFFRPLIDEGKSSADINRRTPKTWSGHLVWLSGLGLQILAIAVSYYHWPLSLGISLAGLVISLMSFVVDKNHTTGLKS
ncbi:hypothetical protein [Algoriphagus marinus]|uniref:hypothetical protein n=1 Tax=Algoriphagus marinus TaxID=1925762 RepID=UPI00094B9D89|nr:hypothetical protein [Algoriphagus marinus]